MKSPPEIKKIIHLSSAEKWRGGEQQIAYLIEASLDTPFLPHVFCLKDSALAAFCQRKEVPFFTYPKGNAFTTARLLKKAIHAMQIDLIHLHDSHAHTHGVLASDLFGVKLPLVLTRRINYPMKKNFLSRHKYNHPRLKKIICISEAIKALYSPDIRDQKRLTRIYSGVDVHRFPYTSQGILHQEYDLPPETRIIGNIATLSQDKDLKTFVKTAAQLRAKGLAAKYFIIGRQQDEEEAHLVKTLIREKNMEDQIIFTGFREDIPKILPEFDVFLCTSRTEGLGTSILDAFACKVPVVATQVGGIPEMVFHQETGMLAPLGDFQTLAAHTYQVIQEPVLRQKLVANASQHLKNFTKENMAKQTQAVYQEILY